MQGHITVDQQLQWLIDRSASHGFTILNDQNDQPDVVVKEQHKENFKRADATVTLVTAVLKAAWKSLMRYCSARRFAKV